MGFPSRAVWHTLDRLEWGLRARGFPHHLARGFPYPGCTAHIGPIGNGDFGRRVPPPLGEMVSRLWLRSACSAAWWMALSLLVF
eukprot:14213342-Alexandrium_andersonii.AAC.1